MLSSSFVVGQWCRWPKSFNSLVEHASPRFARACRRFALEQINPVLSQSHQRLKHATDKMPVSQFGGSKPMCYSVGLTTTQSPVAGYAGLLAIVPLNLRGAGAGLQRYPLMRSFCLVDH